MRKGKLAGGLLALTLALAAQPATATSYDGAWLANDDDFFAIDITPGAPPATFYMYDWGDTSNNLAIIADGHYDHGTVYLTADAGNWHADLTPGGHSLALGSDGLFGFFFDGSSSPPPADTSYLLEMSGTDSYLLTKDAMRVVISDAAPAPVPLPPTIVLFGSGLLGLVATGHARKKSQ